MNATGISPRRWTPAGCGAPAARPSASASSPSERDGSEPHCRRHLGLKRPPHPLHLPPQSLCGILRTPINRVRKLKIQRKKYINTNAMTPIKPLKNVTTHPHTLSPEAVLPEDWDRFRDICLRPSIDGEGLIPGEFEPGPTCALAMIFRAAMPLNLLE